MPWDGSGNVNRTNGTNSGTSVWTDDRDDGVNIRADRHDTHDEDLAGSIENTVALDGQNTTTTDNAILRYATGSDNKFVGVAIGTNELVGRLDGDIIGITIGGNESDAIPTQAEIGAFVPSITDGATDTYTATFGRTIGTGETAVGDVQSANTTTTPTLNGDTVTTKDGSALWADALSGVHRFHRASSSWLVVDPNPSSQVDPIAYSDQTEADAETYADGLVSDMVDAVTDTDTLTWHEGDLQAVAGTSYATIFDIAAATELLGGVIVGPHVGFRLTVDGTVVANRTTSARGDDSAGDLLAVVPIPIAKAASSMKLEAYNVTGGSRDLGWRVVTR